MNRLYALFASFAICCLATAADVTVKFVVPAGADLQVGTKTAHFVDFPPVSPSQTAQNGSQSEYTFTLASGATFNYRAMMEGKLTRAGLFTAAKDLTIELTANDFNAANPKEANEQPDANDGYETGDILINGNERGHIPLAVGDTFELHAMRSWELTNNTVSNYFIEPDFHFAVTDTDGNPLDGVVEIAHTPGSAWADVKALAPGTAIVTVAYDGIALNTITKSKTTPFAGGEIWGAIWPDNVAAFVVTVGQPASAVIPNMTINEEYNEGALKTAGKNIDAEFDVLYYLDSEDGAYFTFTPENVAETTIARPQNGTYHGFSTSGITLNKDGSQTLRLTAGRNIVRMTDAAGNSAYQIIRARACRREISNLSRPDSKLFLPGDSILIQYSGLCHPANKLAGVYNMSAYVTYNGTPNGTSLIQSPNQYKFASTPSAQAIRLALPESSELQLTNGVIQVNGYGDPIGNHRLIDRLTGRDANFNAVAHKTYFGALPEVRLPIGETNSLREPATATPERWFRMDGSEVSAPGHGLYILLRDGKATKLRL